MRERAPRHRAGAARPSDTGVARTNNLTDITLDPVYSSICGYTEDDLDTLFERRIASVSLDRTVSTAELLSAFDVDHIGTEALLFQTGYLTITGEEELGGRTLYRLGYPNREVRQSLNEHLLQQLVQDVQQQIANSMRLERLLAGHDCAGLEELFQAFFASIPYEWHAARRCRRANNDIANYEGYYDSPDRGGVQPPDAQRHRVRGGGRRGCCRGDRAHSACMASRVS